MALAGSTSTLLRFGVFELDLRSGELRKAGALIKLQSQPFKILALLAGRPSQVVTRDEIRQCLWGDETFVDFERSINFSINQIRTALGDDAQNPRYIETLPRRGYRFIISVESVETLPIGPLAPTGSAAPPSEGTPPRPPVAAETRPKVLYFAAITAIVLLAVVVAYLVRQHFSPHAHVRAGNIRLAVLPFSNYSGDPGQEYLSDGITEEIITQLANLRPERLGVIARTSAMRYKHTNESIDQIGRELGVDYVVEGSVRRDADRIRVSAQLIQASDQMHRWAQSYERNLSDILQVENDVARAIAGEIEIELTPQQQAHLGSARSVNPEAYDAYLKGGYFLAQRTEESLKKSVGYFGQAIEKEPGYALAHAGLADSYDMLGDYHYLPANEAFPKARVAAMRALEMDGTLAQAHTSLAFVMFEYDWDWAGAEREFRRALELNPGYATGHHWYAYYLAAMGRTEEALDEIQRAQKLDPLSLIINRNVGWILYVARQYLQAVEQLRKTVDMDPNFLPARATLELAYAQAGMDKEAALESQKVAELYGDPERAAALGHAYAVSGYRGVLRETISQLKRRAKRAYVSPTEFAYAYARVGDKDHAFEWLEKAYAQRESVLAFLLVFPVLDPLRADPRFARLTSRIGLAK